MLSHLSFKGKDKINLVSIFGICGMLFFGPLGYFSIGNIFLENIVSGNYYFDDSLTSIYSISKSINLVYLMSLAVAIPGLIIGWGIGKILGKEIIGLEIGAITGMSVWPLLLVNSAPLEISLYSLGGMVVGIIGCYFGRKMGRRLGKILMQKIKSQPN